MKCRWLSSAIQAADRREIQTRFDDRLASLRRCQMHRKRAWLRVEVPHPIESDIFDLRFFLQPAGPEQATLGINRSFK